MTSSPANTKTPPHGSNDNNSNNGNNRNASSAAAGASFISPEEQGLRQKETFATDSEIVATDSETIATDLGSAADPRQTDAGKNATSLESGGAGGDAVMLALPWRRFDRDLGVAEGGNGGKAGAGGLEVCGRRLAVEDVSNSDEGTGLFTWVREGMFVLRVFCLWCLGVGGVGVALHGGVIVGGGGGAFCVSGHEYTRHSTPILYVPHSFFRDLDRGWGVLDIHAWPSSYFHRHGGRGAYSFFACLSHLTIDHASLSRRGTVPTPSSDTSNI